MNEEKMNGLEENMSEENKAEKNQPFENVAEENVTEENVAEENTAEERGSDYIFGGNNTSEEAFINSDMYNAYGDPVIVSDMPKKKKAGRIAVISIAAVAAVAAIVTILYFVLRKTPEEAVKGAIVNTFGEMKEKDFSEYNNILGLSNLSEDDVDMVFEGTINSMADEEELAGMSIKVDASAEKKDAGYDFSLLSALTMKGETMNVNLYQIGNVLYQEMPEIYNAVFALDMNDLSSLTGAETADADVEEIQALYNKYMIPAREAFQEAITYEKVDTVKIANANGDKVRCKQYLVTVPSEAAKEYVGSFCSYVNEYASTYMADYIYDELGLSQTQFNQVINSIKTYYALVFPSDFKFNIYVNGGKLARTDFNYKFVMLGATVSLSVDFMGEDYVMRDVNGTCTFTAGEEEAKITFSYKQDSSSDELTNTANAKLMVNDEELGSCNNVSKYVISTGAYTNNVQFSIADEMNVYMDLTGSVSNINKGKSYDMTIDSFKIYDENEEYVSLSGKLTCGNLDRAVAQPDLENVVDFMEVIEEDNLDDYLNEDKLNKIMDSWSDSWSEAVVLGRAGSEETAKNSTSEKMVNESEMEIAEGEEISLDEIIESNNVDESTDYDIELEDVEDDEDYSDVALETENYKVLINDPEGYERGYADSEGISIYNDDSNIYYYIYTDTTIEECYQDLADSYEGIDNCEVSSQSLETVNLSDGSEIKCYVMKVLFDGSDITDLYYFFPLEGEDFVLCNAELWENDVDITATAELLVCNGVIEVQ
ncbi:MAG: hypothetical protein J6L77_10870 [Coprococcus sp.]|nr:hypothetical protein [Coprococcus sp.]